MKAVTWLLDTKNWESLKEGINETYKDKVKYIVGAPPLEMMMDSYNTHYDLEGDSTEADTLATDSTRQKLLYKYPANGNKYGYGVGPSNNQYAKDGYYYYTSDNTVPTDDDIDTMYYPGNRSYYWLASPSAFDDFSVMDVFADEEGGFVSLGDVRYEKYKDDYALCPLVCLDSSAHLNLEKLPNE